jgi:hypothetical protein
MISGSIVSIIWMVRVRGSVTVKVRVRVRVKVRVKVRLSCNWISTNLLLLLQLLRLQ